MHSTNNEESKGISPVLQQATNLRTREQWLDAVLHSGRVSRIGQHLALVIYHLADTTTNIAKLSARDLERITGWGRTAIIEHLNELHRLGEFLRVQWGQGRAKSIFELQGVIAEVMAAKKAERDAATKPDTTGYVRDVDIPADATADTSSSVHETAATADTKADTNSCGRPSVREADTKPDLGGTIGGESTSRFEYNNNSLSLSARAREKIQPDWMISEDGGFEGQVFELSGVEVGALQTTYGYLDFPADLVAVDQFLARQFDRAGTRPVIKERLSRMHTYLAKRNREAREVGLRLGFIEKPERKPLKPAAPEEAPSCWFDDDARLQVANGFQTELLETVGNDPIKLREALDEAAGWVGVQIRGPQLVAKVRSQITKQTKDRTNRANAGLARAGIGSQAELTEALRQIEEDAQRKAGRSSYVD